MRFDEIKNGDDFFYLTSKYVYVCYASDKKRDSFKVLSSENGSIFLDTFENGELYTPHGRLVPRNRENLQAIKLLYKNCYDLSYTSYGSELAIDMLNGNKNVLCYCSDNSDHDAISVKENLYIIESYDKNSAIFIGYMNGKEMHFLHVVPVDISLNMLKLEIK